MPANPKYLTNPWARAGKISAGILGGYILATLLHMSIGISLTNKAPLVMTAVYTFWLTWIALMIFAFYSKKAWKIWVLYLGLSILLGLFIFFNR